MKLLLISIFFSLLPYAPGSSQQVLVKKDTTDLRSHSIRLIANVKDMDQDYIVIVVEQVLSYSLGIMVTPETGDEIVVRLPGREMPKKESRIEIDLQENIEVGALPSGYIMLEYRTIH
jgi:hypothetical protein